MQEWKLFILVYPKTPYRSTANLFKFKCTKESGGTSRFACVAVCRRVELEGLRELVPPKKPYEKVAHKSASLVPVIYVGCVETKVAGNICVDVACVKDYIRDGLVDEH